MADERVLTLFSSSLLSKWGFNDGNEPDEVVDWLEADGVDYVDIDWQPVLRHLVRERLAPLLGSQVVLTDVETSHNPIRALTVDGVEIDWYADNSAIALTPESVDVPYPEVLSLVRAVLATNASEV